MMTKKLCKTRMCLKEAVNRGLCTSCNQKKQRAYFKNWYDKKENKERVCEKGKNLRATRTKRLKVLTPEEDKEIMSLMKRTLSRVGKTLSEEEQ